MYPRWWGWTVFPGRHEKSGSSERRQFTFVTTPVALMARTFPRNVGSTTSGSRSRVNVVFTSTFARTALASIRGLSSVSTPTARPSLVRMRRTPVDARIVAPKCSAARARAKEIPPIPPFAYPNVCLTPLISWRSMWPSMRAVPGVLGPAGRPIVVAVTSIALTSSDSKNSPRRGAALRGGGLEPPEEVREGRGGLEDHRLDDLHDVCQERDVLRVGLRVLLRKAGELLQVPVVVVPEEDRVPVREGEEELGVEGLGLVPEPGELEVPDDLGAEEARGGREAGEPDSGEELLRAARSAHDGAAFEDEDLEARLREVARGHEPVVAPADDDRVEPGHGLPRVPASGGPGRPLVMVVVLVRGHGLPVVEAPCAVLGRDLAEGAGHLPDVDGDRPAARADELDPEGFRLPGGGGHLPPGEGQGLELEGELGGG